MMRRVLERALWTEGSRSAARSRAQVTLAEAVLRPHLRDGVWRLVVRLELGDRIGGEADELLAHALHQELGQPFRRALQPVVVSGDGRVLDLVKDLGHHASECVQSEHVKLGEVAAACGGTGKGEREEARARAAGGEHGDKQRAADRVEERHVSCDACMRPCG